MNSTILDLNQNYLVIFYRKKLEFKKIISIHLCVAYYEVLEFKFQLYWTKNRENRIKI